MMEISIDQAGSSDAPKLARLREDLEGWLAGLDPDVVQHQWEADGEVPSHCWSDDSGWALTIEAFPNKPELRDQPVERPLGMFFENTGDAVRDEIPLMRALKRKSSSRYGDLSLPYVVAVSETLSTLFDPTPHRTNVLFGSLKFAYSDALGPRWVRASDGIWRGPGAHPRNGRLTAVLFASQLTPWTVDQAELEWWGQPVRQPPSAG